MDARNTAFVIILVIIQVIVALPTDENEGILHRQRRNRKLTEENYKSTRSVEDWNGPLENNELHEPNNPSTNDAQNIEELVRKWAPVIWHAPGEKYYPISAESFLDNVIPLEPENFLVGTSQNVPEGQESEKWYLVTKEPVEKLLHNSTSFLHGKNPEKKQISAYAIVNRCSTAHARSKLSSTSSKNVFHVTYWFFYAYNEGKDICTANFGFLGTIPIPQINNKCFGNTRKYGNHVGDWEHVSLYFEDGGHPKYMYVSTHDAGAYYKYNMTSGMFVYDRQETRKGIVQHPKFPPLLKIKDGRPVLFSAKGSHGIWTSAGYHRYIRVPRLYDSCGYGSIWKTWEGLKILDAGDRIFTYKGRWGNPKGFCHPLKRVGINFCQLVDGPTGISMKRPNFKCPY